MTPKTPHKAAARMRMRRAWQVRVMYGIRRKRRVYCRMKEVFMRKVERW
jgi:hypothetical protein